MSGTFPSQPKLLAQSNTHTRSAAISARQRCLADGTAGRRRAPPAVSDRSAHTARSTPEVTWRNRLKRTPCPYGGALGGVRSADCLVTKAMPADQKRQAMHGERQQPILAPIATFSSRAPSQVGRCGSGAIVSVYRLPKLAGGWAIVSVYRLPKWQVAPGLSSPSIAGMPSAPSRTSYFTRSIRGSSTHGPTSLSCAQCPRWHTIQVTSCAQCPRWECYPGKIVCALARDGMLSR